MDDFRPEDELKPDLSDRRSARSRKSADYDNEPQINVDDVDLDADERRPTRTRRARQEEDDDYEAEDDLATEPASRHRSRRGRKNVSRESSPRRQYLMMGLGIVVLLLLVVGIGSALKSSPTDISNQGGAKNIDLNSGNSAVPATNNSQPESTAQSNETGAPQSQPSTTGNSNQDISLPPVASSPSEPSTQQPPQGQQRLEIQGDLGQALTQQQGQIDNVASQSTLPTQPATVAAAGNNGNVRHPVRSEPVVEPRRTVQAPRQERQKTVIDVEPHRSQPEQQARTESRPPRIVSAPKAVETPKAAPTQTAKVSAPAEKSAPAVVEAPKASANTSTSQGTPTAQGGALAGNIAPLTSAPGSHYTLQLSSSSSYNNLSSWAKKSSLKDYVIYQTKRNGQPWFVLVSGVYASKDEAKRAVSSLPSDVQAKNPWAKPIHQVDSDLKQ